VKLTGYSWSDRSGKPADVMVITHSNILSDGSIRNGWILTANSIGELLASLHRFVLQHPRYHEQTHITTNRLVNLARLLLASLWRKFASGLTRVLPLEALMQMQPSTIENG
jgi:hypothetical protein